MKKKIGLVVAVIFIGALVFGISKVIQNPKQYSTPEAEVVTLQETCSITEEQAETAWGILQDCGVGSIDELEHDPLLDGLYNDGDFGYRITTKGENHVILYLSSSGEVSLIRYADQTLYPEE